eukprot:TRINITY_DN25768_c0_g1_i1.p1 TRINITY_DN25768_c0_g1~~TRINITY_DN25768_c0_g1_i1.p1  ORF type:complete len:345 (-),score=68.88 TRINITY_DN25768_c0_g1_i1:177-1211(-)
MSTMNAVSPTFYGTLFSSGRRVSGERCAPLVAHFRMPLRGRGLGSTYLTHFLPFRLSSDSVAFGVNRGLAGLGEAESVKSQSVSDTFDNLRKEGKVALVPYITAGDPDLSTTAKALKLLDACGADIIELGVPYSDPLADGPVIQAAATRALQKGTNLDAVVSMIGEVVPHLNAPVVLFSYYNPILKRGLDGFMSTIKSAGVCGLVVPDVPVEETENLRMVSAANGIELVLLTTPTTPKERMKRIAEVSEGFIYLVSVTGVTGARADVDSRVELLLKDLKKATNKPVAVGFGISKPEHAKMVAEWGADGVIVGSAMVKLLAEAKTPQAGLKNIQLLAESLKAALP